jgi:hypothetical protein
MEQAGVVGAIDDHGWWPVSRPQGPPAVRKATVAQAATPQQSPTPKFERPQEALVAGAPLGQSNDEGQQKLLEKLRDAARVLMAERENMQKLRDACRLLIAEREAWKRRALAAEARMLTEEADEMDRHRFDALRRVLARELHPDYAPANCADLPLREALFKSIWPKVEQIERKGRGG